MGHELDSDVTPYEAPKSRVITLVLEDENAVPIGHEPIYLKGDIIGRTTSTAFGYRIGKPIALGYVNIEAPDGAEVELDIARQMVKGRLIVGPAYDPEGRRMRPATS